MKIGIDYSITSPSLSIEKDNKLYFISFFDTKGKNYTTSIQYKYYNELKNIITVIPYTTTIDKTTYQSEQVSKMKSASDISHLICSTIDRLFGTETCKIAIEGFSYSSFSSSSLDLCMYQSFLRLDLVRKYGADNIVIVSPSQVKKNLSGNGKSSKEEMIEAFKSNKLNDDILVDTLFWKYINNTELDYKHIKPIDDICDSYSVLRCI